jgi:lysozyme
MPDDEAVLALALPLVAAFEGYCAAPYRCPAGCWTIGYGLTRYPDGRQVSPRDPPLGEGEARAILHVDLTQRWRALKPLFDRVPSPGQGAALLSLAYNIGLGALTRSNLWRKFQTGDLAGTADEFLVWDKSTIRGRTVSLPGLTRRRQAERALFLGGAT